MTAWLLQDELLAMRARFHRALLVSIGVHAVLAAGLLLAESARPRVPEIIEVTWLEPRDEAPAQPAAPAVEPDIAAMPNRPVPEAKVTAPKPAPGPGAARTAPVRDPDPGQAAAAATERRQRLAELAATRNAVAAAVPVAPPTEEARAALATAPDPGAGMARMASATMMPVTGRGRAVALARGPAAGGPGAAPGPALALNRGPAARGGADALANAALPVVNGAGGRGGPAGSGGGTTLSAGEPAQPIGAGAGDILLEGPAADREVLRRVLPGYPAWARRQAIEAVVTLRFTVLPDGRVREDVAVERTGGFRDFDQSAVAALHDWRFAPLAGGDTAGQWGTITFRFRLRG